MSVHHVTRLTIAFELDYEDVRRRFEAAAPPLDQQRLTELVARKASWDEVLADPVMSLNGNTVKCREYLVGNHTIAERMFRVDPTAMLYVPLRVLLFRKIGAATTFVMDQPSSLLSSLGSEQIAAVGLELDQKLVTFLRHLQAPIPAELKSA
jgi:hypothetical protein